MNQKQLMGWIIALAYTAILVFGIIFLIELEVGTRAIVLSVAGTVTMVIALLALRERNLKTSFFISGLLVINIAIGYSWKEIEPLWKVLGFALFIAEVLYLLLKLYTSFNLPMRKLKYTQHPKHMTNAQVNITEFCNSKYHNKEEIDNCNARLLQ